MRYYNGAVAGEVGGEAEHVNHERNRGKAAVECPDGHNEDCEWRLAIVATYFLLIASDSLAADFGHPRTSPTSVAFILVANAAAN
jgi:hypothetical protein